MERKLQRLLVTGAAGQLGSVMRKRLRSMADILRLSDIHPIEDTVPGEEAVVCDLADADAMKTLVEGCDGIVHLGGISREDSFSKILSANIIGLFNLYEAARANGMPRILFASSNHAIGFYRQEQHIDAKAPVMPDSLYGVSKCYGEALAQMYYQKFGQETAIVRIGSCFPEPRSHRMMASWLSYDDFTSLVGCVFRAPRLGCTTVWGVSNNDAKWWDNAEAGFLGWRPKDNAEDYRAMIEATVERPAPDAPESVYQGGPYTQYGIRTD
jgi:uronate dehydrogenase